MTISAIEAIQLLVKNPTAYATSSSLLSLLSQLSLDATAGNAHGKVTVLYSGAVSDTVSANSIIQSMVASHADVRVINTTEAAAFLESPQFKAAVAKAFNVGIDALDTRGTPANDFLYSAKDGAWSNTSKRFVEATVGEVRILAPKGDITRVLGQTELPTLLLNTKVTTVDGIALTDLKRIGTTEEIFGALVTNSRAQVHFGGLSAANTSTYLALTPDSMAIAATDKVKLQAFNDLIDSLPPDEKARYKAGVDASVHGGKAAALGGVAKGLNKLGLIGGVLGFLFAASAASAEEVKGNHDQAKEIMKLWAIDAGGSELGSIAGTAIGGIAVAALAVAGVAVSAPLAGALVLGAALVGGIYGGDGATELYHLMDDRDKNDRRDIVDKLFNLLFGANSTILTPLPADLNGDKLTIAASLTRDEMVRLAKGTDNVGMAWRYALRELNSFVISDVSYAAHNTDGSLDLYNPSTGQGALTESYLADRAAMLAWKLQFDKKGAKDDDDLITPSGHKPYNEDWDTNTIQGNWDFIDLATKLPGGAPLTDSAAKLFGDSMVMQNALIRRSPAKTCAAKLGAASAYSMSLRGRSSTRFTPCKHINSNRSLAAIG